MLAVRPEARDTGLGRRLKAYQRNQLLARDVNRMVWTWDPLQSRNGYLNLMKLGAVVREYRRDMYGQTDSVLHRGIGTDRFLALWLMDTDRVARRLAGEQVPPASSLQAPIPSLEAVGRTAAGDPVPGEVDTDVEATVVSVAIPADLDALRDRDTPLAVDWRTTTRHAFETYLERGYEVRELIRDDATSRYLMVKRTTDAD
jgi:predicted GNAT superfamily acetyltransferase